MSKQTTKSAKVKGLSGKAKWAITLIVFALAVLTVYMCFEGGSFSFKPGSVQANDDAVTETAAPEEEEESEEETITHKVFISTGKGGTADPTGCLFVEDWDSRTIVFTPDEGYQVKSVKVDGEDMGAVPAYSLTYVKEDHVIIASFEKKPEPTEEPTDPDAEDIEEFFGDD